MKIIILLLLLLFSGLVQSADMESAFQVLYDSKDRKTRITSYVLSAETNNRDLRRQIENRLPGKDSIEKLFMYYALCVPYDIDDCRNKFIKLYPDSTDDIRRVLLLESGKNSYLRGIPKLPVTQFLADLSARNEGAKVKFEKVGKVVDGWMAEAYQSMLSDLMEDK